ncbi:MAG: hypothetical protein IIX18_01315 [Clostridia bacterium]|nr:hypothetical protein [Clostridia bacterium]MBQ6613937.1 hypothetical protein [Clostridia bacterium]
MKHAKTRLGAFYGSMIEEIKKKKAVATLYFSLRFVVIAIGILMLVGENYEGAALCLLTLVLFLLPAFVEKTFRVELPTTLEIITIVFVFAAEILGEIAEYYVRFPIWDTLLHTTTGFLAASVGLSLIDLLNRSERFKINLSPWFVAIVSFCFSMTVGVVWEFFEFGMDVFVGTDMQKDTVLDVIRSVTLHPEGKNIPVVIDKITEVSVNGDLLSVAGYLDIGLYDTMKDLIVNFIGALVFSVFGYFYTKYSGRGRSATLVKGLKIEKK